MAERHDHAGRRARLRTRLADWDAGAIYVTAPSNVRYLTGFTGSNGQVLVTVDGPDLLFTDSRYEGRAAVEAPDMDVSLAKDSVVAALERSTGRLMFEGDHVTWQRGTDVMSAAGERERPVVSAQGAVEALRMVKEPVEVAALRTACRITGEVFTELLDHVAVGRTERDLAVWLERRMVDLGADGVAFDSIVAAGPNGAIPHHEPSARPIAAGDLVTFDIGARVDGYHADMTRTIAVGTPSDEMAAVHAVVHAAQQAGVDAAVNGATCGAVDAASRTLIEQAGHGEDFVHGIGHGVGLDIHEAPIVTARPTATLAPMTAITVEPGVYLRGRGGVRIEDTVVVATDGPPERLTTVPRDLIILPA